MREIRVRLDLDSFCKKLKHTEILGQIRQYIKKKDFLPSLTKTQREILEAINQVYKLIQHIYKNGD
ncbi:MAG: hypothetical protein LBF12_05190 [Christensenellaceae bacterium]|jgi:hypothetical protein|nr:hypothetical protein [Christensenellaceae bacterium]